MTKTVLITGATDGIGLATAHALVAQGHTVLAHGRSEAKLADLERTLAALPGAGRVETYRADLSRMAEVLGLALQCLRHKVPAACTPGLARMRSLQSDTDA